MYHERWEEEVAFDELKTHLRERPVLRSQKPAGVVQEIYSLLVAHAVVRRVMATAAERAKVAPRRISFVGTLKILRSRLAEAPADPRDRTAWFERLLAEVAEQVLPERRVRIHPRAIRKPISHWPQKRPGPTPDGSPIQRFEETVQILD